MGVLEGLGAGEEPTTCAEDRHVDLPVPSWEAELVGSWGSSQGS